MVHFIRNEKNETLLDLEVFTLEDGTPDLRSVVNIATYTDFLLSQDDERQQQTTKVVFDKLSEARGWYWEVYRETINKKPTIKDVNSVIALMVESGANVLKLGYVTD